MAPRCLEDQAPSLEGGPPARALSSLTLAPFVLRCHSHILHSSLFASVLAFAAPLPGAPFLPLNSTGFTSASGTPPQASAWAPLPFCKAAGVCGAAPLGALSGRGPELLPPPAVPLARSTVLPVAGAQEFYLNEEEMPVSVRSE